MKKVVVVLLFVMALSFGWMTTSVNASVMEENAPVIGEESTTTDFYSHWQAGSFGATRLGDQKVAMAMTSGFGLRAGFRTAYDVTDFETQLDLSYMDPGTVAVTFFGPQGSYISGNGAYLSIDFVKHTSIEGKYLVAVAAGTGTHNVSFPEFVVAEQGDWEDNAWQGYQVETVDDIITVSIVESGTDVIVTINGQAFTISSSTFYQDFGANVGSAYFLVGALNFDGSVQTLISNYTVDAAKRTYYETDGVYDTFKTNLIALEAALLEDLSVTANVEAAQALIAALDLDTLTYYDKAFYQDRFDAAEDTLNAAILALGGDIVLNDLETSVTSLETKTDLVTDYATADAAHIALESANLKYSEVDATDFTPEQVQRLSDLNARINAADDDFYSLVTNLVTNQVNAFTQATSDLSSIDLVNAAIDIKEEINLNLLDFLLEADATTFRATYDAAEVALTDATDTLDGWIVNDNTYVVVENDEIFATFMGGGTGDDGNGIFYDMSTFDIRNFTMTISVDSITDATGGWLSFGLMENPEIFSIADDATVQDNKGLFFLIIPQANNEAKVEVYLMSLYSNRFFDAIKTETLTIDLSQDVEIVFGTEMKTVSGVTDEYMSIMIGGDKLESDAITTRSMKTALLDNLGYLYLAGSGGNADSKNTVNVKLINGMSPVSEDLTATYAPEPYSEDTALSYEIESGIDQNVEFYNRTLDVTVKVDDVLVESSNYSFDQNQLTINATFLDTLTAGDHDLVVSTNGGSITYDLAVTAAPVVENDSPVVTIVLISVGSLAVIGAAAFFFIKKGRVA
jgi:hypothetical protein